MNWFAPILVLPLLLTLTLAAQESPSPKKRIAVEGHRGARWVLPENTIPGLHHAMEMGADVLELDLSVTKEPGDLQRARGHVPGDQGTDARGTETIRLWLGTEPRLPCATGNTGNPYAHARRSLPGVLAH